MSEQVTKSSKASPVKESKTVSESPNKKRLESPTKTPAPSSSPSGSSTTDDFYGFQESDSDEYISKKEAFERFLRNLEDVGNEKTESESEGEEEAMTAEDGDAADSDSNQMEIDEGISHADSTEFSDRHDKGRTKVEGEFVDVEMDSVKSGEEEDPLKIDDADRMASENTLPESESQTKVEYCGTCSQIVEDSEDGICCDGKCERWFHLSCSGLSQDEYNELSRDENAKWACNKCSGKPPPVIKPGAKPLLTVRKDLTATPTTPKRKLPIKEDKRPRVDISNPIFLKPFDYGWKRELVYRSTIDGSSKKNGDVYYYTPKGKKLRSLREISEHLVGSDLTVDNFTFWKDALGCDPDKEIIRDAKLKSANKDATSSPSPVVKKVSTPKAAKTPKTTPKLTATVTPLTPDNASGTPTAKASASVTPRVVLKAGKTGSISAGPKFKVALSKTASPAGQTPKMVISKGAENNELFGNFDVPRRCRETRSSRRNSSNNDNQVTKYTNCDDENEGEDEEVLPKNKFRRYGLLANRLSRSSARKRRSKSSSSSSSSDSEESISVEKEIKAPSMAKVDSLTTSGLKPRGNDESQTFRTYNTGFSYIPPSTYNATFKPPSRIMGSPSMKRPRSPEILFRPSDPSSYGIQTSAVPPSRPVGPSISSFRQPFETVLIVDPPPTEGTPSNRRPILQDSTSPVPWTQDCSISIYSVETLHREGVPNDSHVLTSPSKQFSLPPKKQSAFIRAVEGNIKNQSCVSKKKGSAANVTRSSSPDVVVIEEDNSSPPFLMRNSPPPKIGRNNLSPNSSPPSLQANLPAPHLPSCHKPATGNSITSLSSTEETTESNETGSKYEAYRKLKKERWKAKQEMEQIKRLYLKERALLISRKAEEKRLQIEYLQLKVKFKALKLSQMQRRKNVQE